MSTNIVIALDKRVPKADGTYPLLMRIGHNRRTISVPLGISLLEKDWDGKTRAIRKSYTGTSSVAYLNNSLQKKKAAALDIITRLEEKGILDTLSVSDLKNRIYQPEASQSFFHYANAQIDDLKKANRFGTARSYKGVVSVLKDFCNGKDLPFKQITYQFLCKFEIHHASKGNTANGLSVYMRAIRAIFNKAIKAGIVEMDAYPFVHYKIKSVPTDKRALDWDKFKKIIELDIQPGQICFNARNYFIGSFMMYGINFSDMAFLRKENIVNGRIKYRRRKTSKLYDIKITPNLEKILSYYLEQNNPSGYIFPIITSDLPAQQDKNIQWARSRYNKKLKTLAELCGIEENLTGYVSRHSFATQAMLQEVPLNAISTMLGHSSLKTTEVYLKSLPTNILDDFNERILAAK